MRQRTGTRNVGLWGVLALLLLFFGSCLLLAGFGMNLYQTRTESVSDYRLTIPTIEPTATAPTGDAVQIAPTVTLPASPTPLVGSAESNFTIQRALGELFSADVSAWATVAGVQPTHIVEQEGTWDGSQDVAALYKLAYDDQFLYGFVTVQDDVLAQTEPARTAYLGDSLEMEIDTLNDKAANAQPQHYQFVISPGNFGGLEADLYRFRGANGAMGDDMGDGGISAEVTSTRTGDGYTVQFRIPWADLRLAGPPAQLGITLSVNDNDTPGDPKQEIMLSNVPTRRWSQPATWGTVTLRE